MQKTYQKKIMEDLKKTPIGFLDKPASQAIGRRMKRKNSEKSKKYLISYKVLYSQFIAPRVS